MIAVIFELEPTQEGFDDYMDIATGLRTLVENIDGFISIERFESLTTPGKYVSLSFWRDEAAIQEWRNLEQHRAAQDKGRKELFKNYRLRVASVIRDYGMEARDQVPDDSRAVHG